MKYVYNDMSSKLSRLPFTPLNARQHLSVLLEDDYPLSQAAYRNLLSMLLPCSTVVLSQSPQQTLHCCNFRTYDLLLIDQKTPTLSAATIELLSTLTTKTSVVIISAVRQRELNLPIDTVKTSVIVKPLKVQSLMSVLAHHFQLSGS